MGNTDKTLPTLVTDKDDIFPEIQQKEGKFLWIKYKKGLTDNDISEFAKDITNFSIKEITNIKKQLSVLHKTDSETSLLLCELLESSKKLYGDLQFSTNLLDDALQKIEKNSESVSGICKRLKTIIGIYKEETANSVSRLERIDTQIKNLEKQIQSLSEKEDSKLQQIIQLRETCVSYDAFKSLESRVNGAEEKTKHLEDYAAIVKEDVRKLQRTCASNEEFRTLVSRMEIAEDKINVVSKSLNIKDDIAQLQRNNDELQKQVQKLSKKSFFDTMWYKASVGVAALAALGISIVSIL